MLSSSNDILAFYPVVMLLQSEHYIQALQLHLLLGEFKNNQFGSHLAGLS